MEPTGAAPLRPTDLREIGPYRLLGRLGEGGMGTVFLARAPTGRFVALKVVKSEFANQEGFAARFHAEVENARRVASFCTAQVLDNGNTGDGRPYMVTEYIPGTPLSDQIGKYGALEPGPLVGVALGVAAALAAIHVAGLVHRDLKPANVILSISGPRVIDFGIARALDRETGFTLSGELLGSPGWWAPEQVRGEAVSPAADIFAWGCLVAYAGNGRHPFGRGDPITLAHRVLNMPPELGTLPAPLNELARLATSMDPAQRPTAQDLLIALVGGNTPPPSVNPPTLVATEMFTDWRPPQNVVDEPDITAAFTTPPPSDALGKGPTDASGRGSSGPGSSGPVSPPGSGPGSSGPSGPGSGPGSSSPSGTPAGLPAGGLGGVPAGPAPGSGPGPGLTGQASIEERARQEEQAAREQLARWPVQPPAEQGRPPQAGPPRGDLPRQAVGLPPQEQLRQMEPSRQRAADTQPGDQTTGVPPELISSEPDTLGGRRTRGTRWLIAAGAAALAIAVTAAVLLATSARNTATAPVANPSQAVATAGPNDVGRMFPLGDDFDTPFAIVGVAPECGLREYEGKTATKGQLCVVRWSMINPGGARRELIQPVVTMVDDRGAEHDPDPITLPPAILPGGRVDSAFVFDLPMYRKPVKLTATMLENGKQIEAAL